MVDIGFVQVQFLFDVFIEESKLRKEIWDKLMFWKLILRVEHVVKLPDVGAVLFVEENDFFSISFVLLKFETDFFSEGFHRIFDLR